MKEEVVDNLITNKSGIYLDCTLGFGGHAEKILNEIGQEGMVIGLDCDPDAYNYSSKRFRDDCDRFKIFNENYACYDSVLDKLKIKEVFLYLISNLMSRGASYLYENPLPLLSI